MIWVIANEVENDGTLPTFNQYKKAFKEGEIDICWAKQNEDFSFLRCEDIVILRTKDENINKYIREAQKNIGFKSSLESQFTNFLTYDKEIVKPLLENYGIHHPKSYFLSEVRDGKKYFVKPRFGEDSRGVDKYSICSSKDKVKEKFFSLMSMGIEPLIEDYIEGEEITSAVVKNLKLNQSEVYSIYTDPINEIGIHTADIKRDFNFNVRKCELSCVEDISQLVFTVLGSKHFLRIDFRLSSGVPYVIDLNMLPGMASNGYMAECMKTHGIDYYTFIKMLVNTAY